MVVFGVVGLVRQHAGEAHVPGRLPHHRGESCVGPRHTCTPAIRCDRITKECAEWDEKYRKLRNDYDQLKDKYDKVVQLNIQYQQDKAKDTAEIDRLTKSLPAAVVTAIGEFSDHLPVQADYSFLPSTLAGDADLDGGVSINDFNALAGNFGTLGKRWVDGDFDYDGSVSINDFNLLAENFGRTVGLTGSGIDYSGLLAFAAAQGNLRGFEQVTGIPEPSPVMSLVITGLATALLRNRRQRCRKYRRRTAPSV